MKRMLFISFLLGIFAFSQVQAQTAPTKELSNKELKEIQKAVRKVAKIFIKDGWEVLPDQPSIEEQLIKSKIMEKQAEKFDLVFYTSYGTGIGETYNAAKLSAVALAKEVLAEMIYSNVAALIETDFTDELKNADPSTVDKVKSAGEQLISQKLEEIITVSEWHRKINKNYEVAVVIAHNRDSAIDIVKKIITEKLEQN